MPKATRYCAAPIDAEDQRKPRLIRASHPCFARRHVERTAVAGLDIRIATQDDLERAIADQTPVEESQAEGDPVNLREQKLIWRISKMRANLAQAQRRQALERAVLLATLNNAGTPMQQVCTCPVCSARATVLQALRASGLQVEVLSGNDGPHETADDKTPKH